MDSLDCSHTLALILRYVWRTVAYIPFQATMVSSNIFVLQAAFYEYKQGGGCVNDIKISNSGRFVVSCNFEGSVLLWKVKTDIRQTENDKIM